MFLSASDAMLIFDAEGRIAEANPAACRLLEGEYGEIIGLAGGDIVHDFDAAQ